MLVKENKKFVKLKDAYALEVEKCENLSKELNICNYSISCLRTENVSLIAKIEELNGLGVYGLYGDGEILPLKSPTDKDLLLSSLFRLGARFQ